MASVEIDEAALARMIQIKLEERARLALEIYTEEPLKYDAAGYPFARHADQRSIRDPDSQSVTPLGLSGVRIAVSAVAARFIEDGNRPGGGYLIRPTRKKSLAIPVVSGGNLYFQSVKPYEGTDRLWNAVKKAFNFAV